MATKKPTATKKITRTRKSSAAKLRVTQPRKAKAYPAAPEDTNRFFTEAQDGSAFVYVPVSQWASLLQQGNKPATKPSQSLQLKEPTSAQAVNNEVAPSPAKQGYLSNMIYYLYHSNERLNHMIARFKNIISRMNGTEIPQLEKITDVNEENLLHSLDTQNQIHNRLLDELDTCLLNLGELV